MLPLQEQAVGRVRLALVVLIASVGFVLLIACANVANLLLSRALARQKELAVRAALGASRGRLAGQLLTESMLLAIAGGVVGLGLAFLCLMAIRSLGQASVPRLHEIGMNWQVLLFTLAVSLLSGLIFGLAPALRLSRPDVYATLKDAGRGSAGTSAVWGRGRNFRRLLVAAELALSVMLLIGAGLLIRSFSHLQNVPPGFTPGNVLTLELTMTGRKYNDADAVLNTYKLLFERLSALPGVTAAGGVTALPLSGMMAWGPITVEGRPAAAGEKFINADIRVVAADYFKAMNIPLLKGRLFSEQDTRAHAARRRRRRAHGQPAVAGQRSHRQADPHRRIRRGAGHAVDDRRRRRRPRQAGRARRRFADGLLPLPGTVAVAGDERGREHGGIAVGAGAGRHPRDPRHRSGPSDLQDADDGERVEASLAERRFSMLLLACFAGLALGLAAIGIYGVMSYLVSQGTRELGIRLALGAAPSRLLLLVVRQGMTVALAGLVRRPGGRVRADALHERPAVRRPVPPTR